MKRFIRFFFLPLIAMALCLAGLMFLLDWKSANSEEVPVAYQGRFRAMKAYQKLTRQEGPWEIGLFEPSENEREFERAFHKIKMEHVSVQDMGSLIENQHPLHTRLKQAGELFAVLPGKRGEWFSIRALTLRTYSPAVHDLVPLNNFTLFSDDIFIKLRNSFISLQSALKNKDEANRKRWQDKISTLLLEGYAPLAGKSYREGANKALYYPTLHQLKAEAFYYSYPFIPMSLFLYTLGIILMIFAFTLNKERLINVSLAIQWGALFLHSLVLILRCFILGRPPVSNMFETVIYVPWVAVMAGLLLNVFFRLPWLTVASSTVSLILLALIELTQLNSSLDNVQAVLNSQYWLIIHVLMVVGSYGFFILSGVLAHFYLVGYVYYKKETSSFGIVFKALLQCMYIGTALLISGTILGGVWAAESWGRFWDWDPKEAWAFISISIYLMGIHAYTFQHIGNFGLAMTSIAGLQAITFTWYGVNYILGTGLHSYGFGSGGEIYYFLFLAGEILFLALMWLTRMQDTGRGRSRPS